MDETPPCKTHPDAPHGFDRNASHSADRYVCECENWEPFECQTSSHTTIAQDKSSTKVGTNSGVLHKEWVGLTKDDVDSWELPVTPTVFQFAKFVEAKLKEKNIKNTLEPQAPVKESFHKEWVGLDPEQMRNTPIEFNRGALWAERYLKERNHK